MNRYVFHWKDGKEDIAFADSIEEATQNLGFGGGIFSVLDYWEEQKEVPYSEKLIKDVFNPIFIEQIREHSPLAVGETIVIKAYKREYPMTVKAITGCTIEFV